MASQHVLPQNKFAVFGSSLLNQRYRRVSEKILDETIVVKKTLKETDLEEKILEETILRRFPKKHFQYISRIAGLLNHIKTFQNCSILLKYFCNLRQLCNNVALAIICLNCGPNQNNENKNVMIP